MADVTRYVNAASSGGDGTTQALSGANAAFASIQAACTNAASNKSSSDIWFVYCEGSTADTTTVTISGTLNTTDSNPIIFLATGANRHVGHWDASKFHVQSSVTFNGWCQITGSPALYIGFVGLQFDMTGAKGDGPRPIDTTTSGRLLVKGCVARWTGTGTPTTNTVLVNSNTAGAQTIVIDSCVVYGGAGDYGQETYNANASVKVVRYGVTVIDCTPNDAAIGVFDWSVSLDNAAMVLASKNCYSQKLSGATTSGDYDDNSPATPTTATMGTADATSPSGGSYQNLSPAFVDASNKDYQPTSEDTALKGRGTDLSADGELSFLATWDGAADVPDLVATADCANVTRTTWSIGALEAGGEPPPPAAEVLRTVRSALRW